MSNKLAYIYACSVLEKLWLFCKHKRCNWPPLFFPSYGNPCRSHSPSTNTRRSDILLKNAHTILLKVMTSALLKTQTLTWMTEQQQRQNWSNRWIQFPSPNLQKRHGSSEARAPDYSTTWCSSKISVRAGEAARLRGSGGLLLKHKNEIFIPFCPRWCCCCRRWWCRSAQSYWGENAHWKSTG